MSQQSAQRPATWLAVLAVAVQLAPLASSGAAAEPTADRLISDLDQPFLFAYLAWQDKVRVEGGRAVIRGVTNQGGAGFSQQLDLSGVADLSPALLVRVGPGNQAAGLRLLLRDACGVMGNWFFALPAPSEAFVTIVPRSGAALSHPDGYEKDADGVLDLSHVTQWQLTGDWAGNQPMDVEVDRIFLVGEPDAPALAALRDEQRRKAEEALRQHEAAVARAKAAVAHTPQSPWIEHIYTVAPDILAVAIRAQTVVPAHQEPYVAQPGDQVKDKDRAKVLVRGGKEIAWVIGSKQDTLTFYEGIEGEPLLDILADLPETYRLSSDQDEAYRQPREPTAVDLKSKPIDWAQPINQFPMRHIAYLHLPASLEQGMTYRLDLSRINVREPDPTFVYEPRGYWSEAVHVDQLGFRPDDPVKRGFVSLWLGTGRRLSYPAELEFEVLDEATGEAAYRGTLELAWPADKAEQLWNQDYQNYNKTDVYRFDFAGLTTPGRYRVYVAGVGCSYPFPIAEDVWQRAFLVQMNGFYHQRSGIELGPPYTDYHRPRDFHPADGVKVFRSTYSVLDGPAEGGGLAAGSTGELVPEAWGGYHDAGDWNPRRVTHLQENTDLLLELLTMYPDYFAKLDWPLPRDYPVPPMLNEVMFEVDCFRRLQWPNGAVPYGIETDGDPIAGEVSWNQSMPAYVFAPDPWSGFIYTAVAARLANVLQAYDAKLAAAYRDSALRAMTWSETEWQKIKSQPDIQKRWRIPDDRNFAALELYRLTGDRPWHDLFFQDTVLTGEAPNLFVWGQHVQANAAFAYCLLPGDQADPALQAKARRATLDLAQKALDYAAGNAFNLTTSDPGRPLFQFFYSVPQAKDLVRAHFLSGDTRYLAGAVQAALFASGANPHNETYTVGVGTDWPDHPLKLDARWTGQPTPAGQTVYANCDFLHWKDGFHTWPVTWWLSKLCKPSAWDWPIPEAFFDIFLYVAQDEYTVDGFGANAYVWGYLAARPSLSTGADR